MRIVDTLKEVLGQKPMNQGEEKIAYNFTLQKNGPEYLLMAPTRSSALHSRNEEEGGDVWYQEQLEKLTPAQIERLHLPHRARINAALNCSTSMTPPALLPTFYGVQKDTFGQSLASIQMDDAYTPNLAIHLRLPGAPLTEFIASQPYAMHTIAGWPQETFDHLLHQVKEARIHGHKIDVHTQNMILDTKGSSPTLTLIDLGYDKPIRARRADDIHRVVRTFYSMGSFSQDEKVNDKEHQPWDVLYTKLVQAAKNVGLGSDRKPERDMFDHSTRSNRAQYYANKAAGELHGYPIIEPEIIVPGHRPLPPELTALGTLEITQDLSTLRPFLEAIHATKIAKS